MTARKEEAELIILEDTRNQPGKHDAKNQYFTEHGIEVRRTKLYIGDYTLPADQSVCIDTKRDIQELIGDICGKSHERFRDELIRAQESNIKLIVLVENENDVKEVRDLFQWKNPRLNIWKNTDEVIGRWENGKPRYKRVRKYPYATNGKILAKALLTMQMKYGVEFLFCRPEESGAKILELLGVEAADGAS